MTTSAPDWSAGLTKHFRLLNVPSRLPEMDGLRGLAVLLVFLIHYFSVFVHASAENGLPRILYKSILSIGAVGVDIFFVISGFLIYGGLLRKDTEYFTFLKRRVRRIYPTYIAVFLIYVAISALFREESKIPADPLKAIIFLAQSFFLLPGMLYIVPLIVVAWTLSYEFFFYLTVPFFTKALHQWRVGRRVRLFMIAMLPVAMMLVCPHFLKTHPLLLLFIAGMILYEVHESVYLRDWLSGLIEVGVILLFVVSVLLTPSIEMGQFYKGPFTSLVRCTLLSVSIFCLMFVTFAYRGVLSKIFQWRWLRGLGLVSYSFYLIHGLMIHCVHFLMLLAFHEGIRSDLVFFLCMPIAAVASVIGTLLLFTYVEEPFSFPLPQKKRLKQVEAVGTLNM